MTSSFDVGSTVLSDERMSTTIAHMRRIIDEGQTTFLTAIRDGEVRLGKLAAVEE